MPTLKPRAVVACVLMLFALWMTTDGRNGFAGRHRRRPPTTSNRCTGER